jgi:hypothetical protein
MGRDFTLSDTHPSVIINGTKYHYGIDIYRQYMVESAHYEKDYWYFKEKEDLEAFLINLPESADRNLRLKLHPDWRDVTPEQRDAYFEQDSSLFRAMAAERLRNGTAQSFNMDLEGEHGPYEPQRIESRSKEPPIGRVERQLRDWKTYHAWGGLSEAGKLRVLEGELDWIGVAADDKGAVLAREVDFARITPDQFAFVYEDIATGKVKPADPAVATALFDESHAQAETRAIRPTTQNLVEAIWLDVWPRNAAIVDFGLKSQQHYEALYYAVREGEITPEQLDAALGKGEKLTALARSAPSNPHRSITFGTDWDIELPKTGNDGGASQSEESPSRAEVATRHQVGDAENRSARSSLTPPAGWTPAADQHQASNDHGHDDGHDKGHSM